MKLSYTVIALALLFAGSTFAQLDDFFEPKTTLGGYGDFHYNYSKPESGDATQIFDFHRFVLFVSHSWSEKWSLKAEIEIEHNYVKNGQGHLALEQAFLNYHHSDAFGLQAGVLLTAAGLINEYHEPTLFAGVERPSYQKHIIPTTWFGNGIGAYGNLDGFEYRLLVMEGFNSDKFAASSGIRGGRQKGYKVDAEDLLFNLKVDYTGMQGLRAGASVVYNNASGDTSNIPFTLTEAHARYYKNRLFLAAEAGLISYSDWSVEQSFGFYLDAGYDIEDVLPWDARTMLFVRYTSWNTASSVPSAPALEDMYHFTKYMAGINFYPIPEVVVKFDAGLQEHQGSGATTTLINAGVGYVF